MWTPCRWCGTQSATPFHGSSGPPRDRKTTWWTCRAAREQPGKLTYGSAGSGSSMSLFMELLKSMAKVDIMQVPYQGSAKANIDVMGGSITMQFDSMPGAWPLVEGKRLRAIAVSSAKRHPIAPDVPTVAEAGLPGFEAESWLGLAAPVGTPDEVFIGGSAW